MARTQAGRSGRGRADSGAASTVMTPPRIVIESANPAADAHVRRALAAAEAAGWRSVEGWLAPQTRQYLVAPQGDALAGALGLAQSARAEADAGVEA